MSTESDESEGTTENGTGAPPADEGAEAKAAEAAPRAESADEKAGRLEREKAEAHERMLRIAAEFENYKKRQRRAEEEAGVRAREALLREILPVVDNLERAIQAVARGGTLESLAQGVKLVDKQLHASLEKFQVKGFDALGQPFDPNKHEAIQQVETSEHPAGTVATVFARGYTIGDRLLRAAMVGVAKPPSGAGDGERQPPSDEPVGEEASKSE
jgi:molecular chaperone GrpE